MKKIQQICLLSLLIFFSIFFLQSCSSIDSTSAENTAVNFVKQNVKFYSKAGNSTQDFVSYKISNIRSYKESNEWVVLMHASADVDNQTKNNDLVVKLDMSGKVVEFQGKRVGK